MNTRGTRTTQERKEARLNIRLPEEERVSIKQTARLLNMPESTFVRKALRRHVREIAESVEAGTHPDMIGV